jgi:lipopolysaccharide biosynthesis glycosyltransferase
MNELESIKLPLKGQKAVDLCLSSDLHYEPHLWVNISSMVKNSNPDRKYYLYILDGGIKNKNAFYELINDYSNFKIKFVDMQDTFLDAYESRHVRKAAYYRLAIFKLFKDFKKILYIDADSYILSDVGELFDIELGDKLIAGVRDSINYEIPWREKYITHENYSGKAVNYFREYLNLSEAKLKKYFSSGVLLFNIERIDTNSINKRLDQLLKRDFYSHDQDILNLLFSEEETLLLGREWNYFNSGPTLGEEDFALEEERDNYLRGKCKPKIISYVLKPWLKENINAPYADIYWEELERSPYYNRVYTQMKKNTKIRRFLKLSIKEKINYLTDKNTLSRLKSFFVKRV